MKKVGLFFGSFNPIHVGHLIIANFLVNNTSLDQIWLVVSPQNPFKKKSTLANDYDRYHMAQLAIGENDKIKVSKVEFDLPQPSYTVDTLSFLKEKHPNDQFSLIMGGDNLKGFPKWKNYETILEHHEIFVYQRPQYDLGPLQDHERITILDAPLLDISASYVRKLIKEGKSYRYLVPDAVHEAIGEKNLYR